MLMSRRLTFLRSANIEASIMVGPFAFQYSGGAIKISYMTKLRIIMEAFLE